MIERDESGAVKKGDKIEIYFLASSEPQDIEACKRLQKFLAPVLRKLPIEIFSDYLIPEAADKDRYKEKLFAADIVLAFGSGDFLDDEGIAERFDKVLLKFKGGETIAMGILVRNFLFDEAPFSELPLLPTNKRPLNKRDFWDIDDAYTFVGRELRDTLKNFAQQYLTDPPS